MTVDRIDTNAQLLEAAKLALHALSRRSTQLQKATAIEALRNAISRAADHTGRKKSVRAPR